MRRRLCYVLCLLLTGVLYFFENNTGTRIVLCATIVFPLIPEIRRFLFEKDRADTRNLADIAFKTSDAEDLPGDIRAYRPGDPINRIHWKLSAKRNTLLIREPEHEKTEEREKQTYPIEQGVKRKWIYFCLLLFLLLPLLLLFPDILRSVQALCNRIFDASERVNAYLYTHFSVPEGQSIAPAILVLLAEGMLLLTLLVLTGSRLLAFALFAGIVLFEVYFGLAFPAPVTVLIFFLMGLFCAARPRRRWGMLVYLGTTLVISLFIALLFPGVHLPTETASERVRDWMSRFASQYTESAEEAADSWMETRHVQTKTLSEGKEEANPLRTYRLVSWDEEQISMPHWVDYVKIVLLLFLTILLVTVPFLPFVLLNARRKKALAAMEEYRTDPVNDAVCGIFRRVIAWFEVLNLSGGNTLYSEREGLLEDMLPEYRVRFAEGERLFEEAAYSDHLLDESARGQLLRLLEETQRILSRKANWKQRLRLKYWDYLWINA